jgi:hypothetical protein
MATMADFPCLIYVILVLPICLLEFALNKAEMFEEGDTAALPSLVNEVHHQRGTLLASLTL